MRELGWLIASFAMIAAAAWLWSGAGPINGDAAAYAAQVAAGDLSQRVVHVGYLWVWSLLAPAAGSDLPRWMDLGSAACVALAVAAAAWDARREGGRSAVAALGAAAALLPLAPFAEVDPAWIALVAWARVAPGAFAALLVAAAVAVSPVALLAVPWVALGGRGRWALGGAAIAVIAVTIGSGGAWWLGDRGVFAAPPPLPLRSAQEIGRSLPLAMLPLALAARGRLAIEALSLLPLVLAPPDVAAWGLPAIVLARWAAQGATLAPDVAVALLLGVQVVVGGATARRTHERIGSEAAVVAEVAGALGPTVGLIAPWTWGSRVGVAASGDPYGVRWRPPGAFLRDQREAWCGAIPPEAIVLPPGPDGPERIGRDDPRVAAGCAADAAR